MGRKSTKPGGTIVRKEEGVWKVEISGPFISPYRLVGICNTSRRDGKRCALENARDYLRARLSEVRKMLREEGRP